MSSATPVPETRLMQTESAWTTLRRHGGWELVKESFIRMRYSDGFSHSRALAFQITLAFIPFLVAVEGFAAVFHHSDIGRVIEQTLRTMTPGATESVVRTASDQAAKATNTNGGVAALAFGLVASLISIATAFGQIERGANRIYGVEQDRPGPKKYGLAALLGVVTSVLAIGALGLLVAGSALGTAIDRQFGWGDLGPAAWNVVRYPLGIALAIGGFALLFRVSPRRQQPRTSWLVVGSGVSVVLWLLTTGGLALYVDQSSSFGAIYGPLTGVMALLLWSLLSSISLFLGLSFAAQLEAFRAGVIEPVDEDKAEGQVAADEETDASGLDPSGRNAPTSPDETRPLGHDEGTREAPVGGTHR
ncbi:MAG: hypothetical protein NVS3B12_17280 [Acidimicrobiales bacterium]